MRLVMAGVLALAATGCADGFSGSAYLTQGRLDLAKRAATVEGSPVKFMVADGKVMINDAAVITADVETTNGVIHVIDSVILPK